MSRDGLLPKRFSHIHPKYKTPDFATIITAIFVIVPMLFIPSALVTDLCSMGTLFAFVLVCAGVLKLQVTPGAPRGTFRTPYLNGKWIFPLLLIGGVTFLMTQYKKDTLDWVTNQPVMNKSIDLLAQLNPQQIESTRSLLLQRDAAGLAANNQDLNAYLESLAPAQYEATVRALPFEDNIKFESGWHLFQHKIPMWLFLVTISILAVLAFQYNLSMIPMLGLTCCFYMMAQIHAKSWFGFFIWLAAGLVIYFGYGYKNSKLRKNT
jgi:basic amino acid/polyamine antiporter, APA family